MEIASALRVELLIMRLYWTPCFWNDLSIKKAGDHCPCSKLLKNADQAVLDDLVSRADMVAARAMHPATARKPMGSVVWDMTTLPLGCPLCLLPLRQKWKDADS